MTIARWVEIMEECCKKFEDRETKQVKPDLLISVCKTCGRKHYELTVDPGVIGLRGASL